MQRIFLIIYSLIFFAFAAHAIYIPPKELRLEVKNNKVIADQNPASANAYFNLAMSYAYTGRILEGWDALKKVHEYDKDYAGFVVDLYTEKTREDPKKWQNYFKLAFGYYFIDQKDKAKASFKKILDMDAEHIWAMGFIALLEGEQGHYDSSIKWCSQALKIEPDATAIHFLLSEALGKKGDFFGSLGEKVITLKLMAEDALFRNDDQ